MIAFLIGCSQPQNPLTTPQQQKQSFENALLQAVTPWLGTPYKWGGTTKDGVDCSGFVQNIYAEFGVKLPRCSRQQRKIGKEVRQLQWGDLVFFMLPGKSSHVGIFLGKGNFVHSSKSKGVTVSSLDSEFWKQHFIAARRVKQPTN